MSKFLYYPVKNPINQSNLFGASEGFATATGQKGHPGLDFECPMYTPIYAPCDGDAFYVTDRFGGDGIYIRTADKQYNIILWHMVPAGTPGYPMSIVASNFTTTPVKAGQLLGYSGDSGYPAESNGPHMHFAVMPINALLSNADPKNGYGGCVDPMPFFNGEFAQDISLVPAATAIVAQVSSIVSQIAASPTATPEEKSGLLAEVEKVVQLLKTIM